MSFDAGPALVRRHWYNPRQFRANPRALPREDCRPRFMKWVSNTLRQYATVCGPWPALATRLRLI